MLALELEGPIVVQQPIEPAIKRVRRGWKHKHLMDSCPERALDDQGLGVGAHHHGGDKAKWA
jgi:hypothetical protein